MADGDTNLVNLKLAGALTVTGNIFAGPAALNVNAALSQIAPYPLQAGLTNSTLGVGTVYFVPFDLAEPVYASRINFFLSNATTFSATNLAGTFGMTFSAALYTRGSGTGTAQAINTIWSQSAAYAFSQSSNSNLSATIPNGLTGNSVATISTTFATSNASTFIATNVGGFRVLPLPVGSTLSAGRYWLAVGYSSGAATAGTFQLAASILQQTQGGQIGYMPNNQASAASNAGYGALEAVGSYSATQSAFPASLAITNMPTLIPNPVTATVPFFNISGFATGASNL